MVALDPIPLDGMPPGPTAPVTGHGPRGAGRLLAARAGEFVLLLLAVSVASFGLLGITRGDAAVAAVQATGVAVTPQRVAAMRMRLDLDDPAPVRYLSGLWRALHGDFGISLRTGRPVGAELADRIGPTLTLAVAGAVVALVVAVTVGLLETLVRVRAVRAVLRTVTLILVSLPAFALAFVLVEVLALHAHLLPTGGTGSVSTLVLPALVLGLPAGAGLGRVLSSRLHDAMDQSFVLTARACGYSRLSCVVRFALPEAAVTSLVVAGNVFAYLVTGTLVAEVLFGWPGVGDYLIDALDYRDGYPLQAACLFLALLVIVVRGATLVVAALIDPRAGSGNR